METVKSPSCVADWVANQAIPTGGIVVIDGATGSGKSTLAKLVARETRGFRVSLDNYIDAGGSGSYIQHLELVYLKDDIIRLREQFALLFVEGVCAQDALAQIDISWSSAIYVKAVSKAGVWNLGLNLITFCEQRASADAESGLDEDVLEYHARVRPHETAIITYVRVEQ